MKLGRIGGNTDRTDWGGVYYPSDNVVKIEKTDNVGAYQWRRNYTKNTPFYYINYPSISYGDNGNKIYVSDGSSRTNSEIRQYDLTTPYEPSTAAYNSTHLDLDWGPTHYYLNTAFSYDGTKMYISYYGGGNDSFTPPEQFDLSTPWDVSTAVPRVKKFYLGDQTSTPYGIYVKPDGTKFYIAGSGYIWEYSMSTAYDVSTATYVQNFSITAQESSITGVEFKTDGTKMYVIGTSGDDVNEYDLSTAWDISTASYSQNFSIGAQETAPYAVRFKTDGTKFFVTGSTGDDVNEYSLSTPWDVSTASFVHASTNVGDTSQYGVTFATDGTKMYTVGGALDYIKEWNLSTAWDVSTATFHQNSGDLMTNPIGIVISNSNATGVATTSVTGTRGDLGISTSSHSTGVDIDGYFLELTTVIDQAGSGNFDAGSTQVSLDTTSGITTGSGKYLSIDNEIISLSAASISGNSISGLLRGQLGTSDAAHTDESNVKFLTESIGIGTLFNSVGVSTDKILISTPTGITTQVNVGGFIRIDDSEFVGVTTIFTGGNILPVDNKLFVVDYQYKNVRSFTLNTNNDIRSIDGIVQADAELSGEYYHQLSGVAISKDGTKFFVIDVDVVDRITEFSLSTPYELSSATRTGNYIELDTGTAETFPLAIHFSDDGRKLYIGGSVTNRTIYMYTLSTAWDITTATLTKQKLAFYSDYSDTDANYDTLTTPQYYGAGTPSDVYGLAVSKDGTNMLVGHNMNFSEFRLLV